MSRVILLVLAMGISGYGIAGCGGAVPPPAPVPDPIESEPEPEPVPEPEPEPEIEAGRVVLSPAVLVGGNMPASVRDGITSQVVAAIQDAAPLFRKCYGRSVAKGSSPRGDVGVDFLIEPGGSLDHLRSGRGTSLTDEALVACTLRVFEQLSWPSPPANYSMSATLQFFPE